MKHTKSLKGFTLIELIVVIAIIGILMAASLPLASGYLKENRATEANGNAMVVAQGVQQWLDDMETGYKPLDDTSKASLFGSTFPSGSTLRLTSNNDYKFYFPTIPGGAITWKQVDKTTTATAPASTDRYDLTQYLTGLKSTKSGSDIGCCYVCIDADTMTVKYAAWTATYDANWISSNYLMAGDTSHAITDLSAQQSLISTHTNYVIGVYPFSSEL